MSWYDLDLTLGHAMMTLNCKLISNGHTLESVRCNKLIHGRYISWRV